MFKKLERIKFKSIRKHEKDRDMKLEKFLLETDKVNENIKRESVKLLLQDVYFRGRAGLEIDLDYLTKLVREMGV